MATSRPVEAGGLRWHVQRLTCANPQGPATPVALLLHGTGSATHSWRHLAPLLADRCEVIAPDLPGHGFTVTPSSQSLTLPDVAGRLAALLRALDLRPALVVGHSAGAAIALRMALDRSVRPTLIVSVNGALLPPQGPSGRMFLPLARLLASNPLVPPAFAAWAHWPKAARRMLSGTGSQIDELGERCYAHLMQDARHAAGALRLMASWDLSSMSAAVAGLSCPLLLLAADRDRMVPPEQATQVALGSSCARTERLPGLGHLAHEEDAARVAASVLSALADAQGRAACGSSVGGQDPGPSARRPIDV